MLRASELLRSADDERAVDASPSRPRRRRSRLSRDEEKRLPRRRLLEVADEALSRPAAFGEDGEEAEPFFAVETPAALRKRQGAAEALRRIEERALSLGSTSRRLDELLPEDRAPSVRVEELPADGSVLRDRSAALRLPRRDPLREALARDPARSAPDPKAGR